MPRKSSKRLRSSMLKAAGFAPCPKAMAMVSLCDAPPAREVKVTSYTFPASASNSGVSNQSSLLRDDMP